MSLAQRWKERALKGETEQPKTVGSAGPGGKGTLDKPKLMQLLDAGLEVALKALKKLRSKADKVAHKKAKLLPEFSAYVERLMDKGWKHDLLPWYMVWCLDTGFIEPALKIGKYCMEKGIEMPKDFVRPIPVIIADLAFKWAEDQIQGGHSPEPYFTEVYTLVTEASGDDPWAQPDEVRAKYFKLKGLMEYEAGNLESAQEILQKALDLKATVKTVLKEVTKKLEAEEAAKKEAEESGSESTQDGDSTNNNDSDTDAQGEGADGKTDGSEDKAN